MSINSLATETLSAIFEAPLLEPQDLASLCRVDKRYNAIAKPLLYRTIAICTRHQVDKLIGKDDREDLKLIGSIAVAGEENPWEIGEMEDLHDYFADMHATEKMMTEAGSVEKLLTSDFARSSQITALFVHQVVEDPTVLWNRSFEVVPQVFGTLKDLSIVSHRGGVNVLQYLLNRACLPNLERLTLCDVLCAVPAVPWTSGRRRPISFDPMDYENLEIELERNECDLFKGTRLKLLVSPPNEFLNKYPTLLQLVVVPRADEALRPFDKYAIVYISTRSGSADEINYVFYLLAEIANSYSSYSLRYLAIPSLLETRLSQEQKDTLAVLTNLGVAVHRDGDLGRSIAPESFFEFRKKEEEIGFIGGASQ